MISLVVAVVPEELPEVVSEELPEVVPEESGLSGVSGVSGVSGSGSGPPRLIVMSMESPSLTVMPSGILW